MVQSTRSGGGDPIQQTSYGLHGVGHRTSVSGGASPRPYSMLGDDVSMNRYTSTPFDDRAYDANGNHTSSTGEFQVGQNLIPDLRDYAYDSDNQLVRFDRQTDVAVSVDLVYDAFGRVVRKIEDDGAATEEVRYSYLPEAGVGEEQDETGATLATYVYGNSPRARISMRRDADGNGTAEDYYFVSGALGSVLALMDSSGAIVEAYAYDDWGLPLDPASLAPLADPPAGNPYYFAGKRFEWTLGLYDSGARHLDPSVGRFSSRDPLGLWGDAVHAGNGTAYAGCNPWSRVDPNGLSVLSDTGGGSFEQFFAAVQEALAQEYSALPNPYATAPPLGEGGTPDTIMYSRGGGADHGSTGNPKKSGDTATNPEREEQGVFGKIVGGLSSAVNYVGSMGAGAGKSLWSTVEGAVSAIAHPVETVEGIGEAIANPGETIEAAGSAIADTAEAVLSGDPEPIGGAIADVGSLFLGGAGVTKVFNGVKNLRTLRTATRAVDPNKLNHIFRPGRNLDDLVRANGGSTEGAFNAVQQAANQALKDGLLTPGANGVLPGAGGGAILNVNGVNVQMIGGRVIDGAVHIGSFIGS